MEINKQLFEDVLARKLKGTFILRNKQDISSDELYRNNSYYSETPPYKLLEVSYTPNRLSSLCDWKSNNDIIDFIPDTNMKTNELTIEIPNDKVIDWDESKKQNKIVFRKKLTYNDIIENAEIGSISNIHYFSDDQMRCLLAKNRLANVATYLNENWKPKLNDMYYGINLLRNNNIAINVYNCCDFSSVPQFAFKSKELTQQAIEILGEETVKLALEPLGI